MLNRKVKICYGKERKEKKEKGTEVGKSNNEKNGIMKENKESVS